MVSAEGKSWRGNVVRRQADLDRAIDNGVSMVNAVDVWTPAEK